MESFPYSFGVGDGGKILRFGPPSHTPNDQAFAPGVVREKYHGGKTLNGVARTHISGEEDERLLAVGDDGTALIRTQQAFKTDDDDTVGGPLWVKRTTGTGRDLNAVSLARGTRAGWAVGDEGTILRTTNSGSSWGIQASHTTRHLRAVVAVHKDRAWAVGDEGEIHSTDDAGATWRRKQVSGVSKHLRAICAGTGLRVAVGDDGMLVYRYEGKWGHAELTGKHLRAVAISPSGFVIAVGDDGWIGARKPGVFGGNEASRWKKRTDVTSKHLRAVVARDDKRWMIVGDDVYLTTSDGGASWTKRGAGDLNAVC